MEDAHLALPDFDTDRCNGLFGVFDGHGGAAVAQIVAERLPGILLANQKYKAGQYSDALSEVFFEMDRVLDTPVVRKDVVNRAAQFPASEEEDEEDDDMFMFAEEGGESDPEGCVFDEEEEEDNDEEDLEEGLDDILDEPDAGVLESNNIWISGEGPDCMGTTAVVALVCLKTQEVFVANAGDSRCILISGKKGVDLSRDHKPILKSERLRIKKAGGFVLNPEDGGRVDGNLSLSRAFGDFAYKRNKKLKPSEQKISCEPEVRRHQLDPNDSFLALGCDGIWEKASTQKVANFLRPRCSQGSQPQPLLSSACAAFLDSNLARSPIADMGLGCDNMTLMVVDLRSRIKAAKPGESSPQSRQKQSKRRRVEMRLPRAGRRRVVLRWNIVLKQLKSRG
jgi:protein phosphatase 1G